MVVAMPPDEQLKAAVAEVDGRIAAADDYFERQVLPQLQAAEVRGREDNASPRHESTSQRAGPRSCSLSGTSTHTTHATEARAAHGRGHNNERSAEDE
jgi:hypothetical protein